MVNIDHIFGRHDDQPLQSVIHFTDIAGPGIFGQYLQSAVGQPPMKAVTAVVPLRKIADHRHNIHRALSDRRNGHLKHADQIEQILTEIPFRHHLMKITVGGGDDAAVHGDPRSSADGMILFFVKSIEEPRLNKQRQSVDLIQKQRSAGRQRQHTGFFDLTVFSRLAEEFFFQQFAGHRRTVQTYKSAVPSGTVAVDILSQHHFAGTALPGDQHRAVHIRKFRGHTEDLRHTVAFIDQQRILVAIIGVLFFRFQKRNDQPFFILGFQGTGKHR